MNTVLQFSFPVVYLQKFKYVTINDILAVLTLTSLNIFSIFIRLTKEK